MKIERILEWIVNGDVRRIGLRRPARIYNRHGVFDTNRLGLIIYTPLLTN